MVALVLYVASPTSVPVIRCSPPSWAAHIALLESGLEHRVIELDFERGEHRSPAVLEKNPEGTVPFLVDGDRVLTDTMSILQHVAARAEHAKTDPAPSADERRVLADAVKQGGMSVFRALMREADSDEAVWEPLRAALDRWEWYLEDAGAAARAFDAPAVLVFVYVVAAQRLGLPTDPWPCLQSFVAESAARVRALRDWPELAPI